MVPSTASESKTLTVQRTGLDLDSFEEKTLIKEVNFVPVKSAKEAVEKLGGDAEKFLRVINEGLESEARRNAIEDSSIPWLEEDEESEEKTVFSGTLADRKVVNGLILNLAKSLFGYKKEIPTEKKRAAKESAMNLIKGNEQMREGLKQNAAA